MIGETFGHFHILSRSICSSAGWREGRWSASPNHCPGFFVLVVLFEVVVDVAVVVT
jgi:hypothetical protein